MLMHRNTQNSCFDVSLCIVNWNAGDLVIQLLNSAYSVINNLTFEAIVVDNASSDRSVQRILREYPQVVLIQNTANVGYGAALNQALARARGRHLLVLNSDVVLLPGAVEHMARFLDNHLDVGAVGGICLDGNQQPAASYGFFPRPYLFLLKCLLGSCVPRFLELPAFAVTPTDTEESPFEVEYIVGACMLVRREVLDEVGLLDERFFAFFEETDWCFRMQQHGWKRYLLPKARIIHLGGASFGQVPDEKMKRFNESFYLYLGKHYGSLTMCLVKLADRWRKWRQRFKATWMNRPQQLGV